MRRCQTIADKQVRIYFSDIQVLFQAGVGLITGQGSNPEAMLRWSDDGGRTWSNELTTHIGEIGEYKERAIWYRLGYARNRVFELSITDPVKVVILGAYGNVMEGTS